MATPGRKARECGATPVPKQTGARDRSRKCGGTDGLWSAAPHNGFAFDPPRAPEGA
jgi:hypothetical protein